MTLSSGDTRSFSGRVLDDLPALVEHGASLHGSCTAPIKRTAPRLTSKVAALKSSGTTALGPALGLAVGIAGAARGSRIVVFTDGLANMGLGKLTKPDGLGKMSVGQASSYYMDVAQTASERGVTVSVLALEGEECSMENLGTTADVTGGQVDIVNPAALSKGVASLLKNAPVATAVECTVVLPRGLRVEAFADAGDDATASAARISSRSRVATRWATRRQARRRARPASPRRRAVPQRVRRT